MGVADRPDSAEPDLRLLGITAGRSAAGCNLRLSCLRALTNAARHTASDSSGSGHHRRAVDLARRPRAASAQRRAMTSVVCSRRRIALLRKKIPAQTIVLVLFGLFFSSCSGPQSHENSTPRSQSTENPISHSQSPQSPASGSDYYLLALS